MTAAPEAQLGMSWAEAKGQPLPAPPTSPGNFPLAHVFTGKAPVTGVSFLWSYCGNEGGVHTWVSLPQTAGGPGSKCGV